MVQFLKSKRNIAQTMHINDVFAMNSKMRNKTSFEMKQKTNMVYRRNSIVQACSNTFLLKHRICLFQSRIPKTVLGLF